ncbi:hypothetical protein [Petrimonas sulfuriphila]|uniref:hypothetical protein n=1 Tax=Petrimonas sulfuriphila TaxID=285070 RepID=UPI003EC14F20
MARKNYSIDEVLRTLGKKNDCSITTNKEIFVLNGKDRKNDLGNGSWGKIDFLVKYCGFKQYFVSKW